MVLTMERLINILGARFWFASGCENAASKLRQRMRQVSLERDIDIAVNGCSGFATSTQKGPFMEC